MTLIVSAFAGVAVARFSRRGIQVGLYMVNGKIGVRLLQSDWAGPVVQCIAGMFFGLAMTASCAQVSSPSSAAVLATDSCELSIPASPLSTALADFAEQCGVSIVVPVALVDGYRSSSVVGTWPLMEGLQNLLRRTPFVLVSQELPIRLIKRPPTVAAPIAVEEVKQDASPDTLHEVVVTGIRASLIQSLDTKRWTVGVVDAISAEDMGQFPDSNLAESLQRITGVTISRRNGEGSQITVRGFTGNYNLVTYNGRQLPVVHAPVEGAADSRAFEFSHLASENIQQVRVYKSRQAGDPLGGIGGTVDVQSYRPLELGVQRSYVSVHGVHDLTHSEAEITPELSALGHWRWSDWGLLLSASAQQRKSGRGEVIVPEWQTSAWVPRGQPGSVGLYGDDCAASGGDPWHDACGTLVNAPGDGALYSLPQGLAYRAIESSRKRYNSYGVLQYQPNSRLTATIDYIVLENQLRESASEMSLRLTDNRSLIAFNSSQVPSPATTIEAFFDEDGQPSAIDLGFGAQSQEQDHQTHSMGFNVNYLTDHGIQLTLDAHRAHSESGPAGSSYGNWADVRFGANVVGAQQVDWRGDIPVPSIRVDDHLLATQGAQNGQFDAADLGTQVAYTRYSRQKNRVEQIQLQAQGPEAPWQWLMGVDTSRVTNDVRFSDSFYVLGDWGIRDPALVEDTLFQPVDFAGVFSDFDREGFIPYGFSVDGEGLMDWALTEYASTMPEGYRYSTDWAVNRRLQESTTALFGQLDFRYEFVEGDLDGQVGARALKTEVQAQSHASVPSRIVWYDNDDFDAQYTLSSRPLQETHTYNDVLPNVNLRWQDADRWSIRIALSQSMARADYGQLSPEVFDIVVTGIHQPNQTTAYAQTGNTQLQPLLSNNLDLTLDWSFGESGYASVGYYQKRIQNFIGYDVVNRPVHGLRDPSAGPRAEQAIAALQSQPDFDGTISGTELFNQIAAAENDDFNPSEPDNVYYGNAYDIFPQADDPLFQVDVLTPANNKKAKIWGMEYALQSFFGKTGWGFLANYTSVNGDIGYDLSANPSATQFALLGLSDSFNLVALYEKHRIHGRLAYHWRGRYLEALAQEPRFVASQRQWDLSLTVDLSQKCSVVFEGLNLTGENSRRYGRTEAQLLQAVQLDSRFQVGIRYQF